MAFTIANNVSSTVAQYNLKSFGAITSEATTKTLSTGYKVKQPTSNPLDPNIISGDVCYSQFVANLDPNKKFISTYKQGDVIDINGNEYIIYNQYITQEQANNPHLWEVINIYNSTTNTNESFKVINSDLKKIPNIRVKAFIPGENLYSEEVVYFNTTNSTTKELNKVYKFDPINNTNVIDRNMILGVNLIDAEADDICFVFEWGDLSFIDRYFAIGKYYIGSDSKLTATPPTTGVLVEMGFGDSQVIYDEGQSSIFINMKQPRLL